ncbi:MAG: hypothetical protein JSS01_12380 [Proteobacteria bacterium]|nr:hypothetical protein [Pseudomonadota bacterium]
MRNVFLGACLCAAASGAAALSLGASRGAVVLGSPIDLTFEVRPDPGQELASSCIAARLVSGTTSVADSRVRVTPIVGGTHPMVRVQANMMAEEPVLTVTLLAGCDGRVTRTYTFLADLPATGPVNPQGPLDIARLGNTGTPRGALARGEASAAFALGSSAARVADTLGDPLPSIVRRERPQARAATGGEADRPPRPRARPVVPAPAATAASRLVMEPLDLWLDAPLALRLSREEPLLLSAPNEARRAEFAAMRQLLNSSPADLQQTMGRLAKLEADAAQQRAQAEAEREQATGLRAQLAKSQAESFSATVVYALGGALALAVAGIAWLLRRRQSEALQAWHHSVAVSEAGTNGAVASVGPDGEPQWEFEPEAADTWQPSTVSPEPMPEAQTEPGNMPDTMPMAQLPAVAPAPQPQSAPARPGGPRSGPRPQAEQPEALFDIQQQAEFFISIGEHEQAIEVLRRHIEGQGDATPSMYVELLRLFHMLGRTDSFNQLRGQFQECFNVQVPRFTQFKQLYESGHALEDYPEALAQIEALWSSPEVMVVLDELLYRRDDGQDTERFELAAFDDLLLLHTIAQTTPAHLRGAPPPRTRTTPRGSAARPAGERPATSMASRSLDSVAGDLSLMPSGYDQLVRPAAVEEMLDVDLSAPTQFSLSEHWPAPAAAAPVSGPSVGFAMESDRQELSLELEQIKRRPG